MSCSWWVFAFHEPGLTAMLLKAWCNHTSCGIGSKFALHISGLQRPGTGVTGAARAAAAPTP